ncbi:MAG: hypothetical protein ACKN87_12980, partial [Microcystis aeruginosa]
TNNCAYLLKLAVKTAPKCQSWEQGEEVRAFVLKFLIRSLKALVQLTHSLCARIACVKNLGNCYGCTYTK